MNDAERNVNRDRSDKQLSYFLHKTIGSVLMSVIYVHSLRLTLECTSVATHIGNETGRCVTS